MTVNSCSVAALGDSDAMHAVAAATAVATGVTVTAAICTTATNSTTARYLQYAAVTQRLRLY
jgi:hypothetical protein